MCIMYTYNVFNIYVYTYIYNWKEYKFYFIASIANKGSNNAVLVILYLCKSEV